MKNITSKIMAGVLVSSATFCALPAWATTLMVSEGDKITASLSLQYPTRIYFEYDAGAQLIFNTAEGTAPEVAATVDSKGDVYLSVVSGMLGQGVSGFLTTEGGRTYVVDFKISDIPAEQIKIISKEAKEKADALALKTRADKQQANIKPVKWKTSSGHRQTIAELMRHMYHGRLPEGFVDNKRGFRLGGVSSKLNMTMENGLIRSVDRHLVAENVELITFRLRNSNAYSVNPVTYIEEWRPYTAVAFTSDSIAPQSDSLVYVIRDRKAAE